jgi:glycosyltransferase involved in cell wall biosynthesis
VNLLVATEGHFSIGATGATYAEGPATYPIWAHYLKVFDQVTVLARVGVSNRAWPEEAMADGPSVEFCALPDYIGPWQYLRTLPKLKALVREAVLQSEAYILRVPGLVGRLAWHEITRLRRPFALEVVGDPWDALGGGTWPSVFRPVFRHAAVRDLKRMCKGAAAIHYVTRTSLQERYPPGKGSYVAGFSDALMDAAFASPQTMEERYRRIEEQTTQGCNHGKTVRVGFIGSLSQMYKGPDVLLRAAALCRIRGLDLEIQLAGDGRCMEAMKHLALRLGIADRTRFAGQLPFGRPILDFLDSVDLFVLPSRAEGLPRALLEAMARGCPCIGSKVGGIPELLNSDDIVPAGDADALARKILEVAGAPQRLKQMAARNLEKAKQFSPELLREARPAFLRHVRLRSGGIEE